MRWRDVEWVDFTSDAGSGPLEQPAAPAVPPPGTSGGGNLPRLGRPAAPAPGKSGDAIPGLVARFARMPLPRLAAAPPAIAPLAPNWAPPAGLARAASATPTQPQRPSVARIAALVRDPLPPAKASARLAKAPAEPAAQPTAALAPALGEDDDDRPLPASFLTPTSTAPEPAPPAAPVTAIVAAQLIRLGSAWRRARAPATTAVTTRLAWANTVVRNRSTAAASALGNGLSRRSAAPRALRIAEPAPPTDEAPAAAPSRSFRLFLAIRQANARFRSNEMRRVRNAATVGATIIVVAALAYVGGSLLASLAGATPDAKPPAPAPPAVAAAPVPVPAAVTMPADPVGRAAFYLARAKSGDAVAQYDVGVLYARGEGLVQDYVTAASWFRSAAAQGNVAAEFNLGVLYERGLGVPASAIEAVNWYRSAADRNHAGAQYNLALALTEGRGTEQDFAAAARWYERAARQGVVPAMINLAIQYERGKGVDRSPLDAYAWYSAAAERGDAPARQRADELFRQFSDEEKARAQGLAATIGAAIHAPASPA